MAQLVAGFLVIRWVLPEDLGVWQTVRLAQIYAFILLAGINNGLSRELPFFLGKSDKSFADRLAGTALLCTTLGNVLILLGGAGCLVAFSDRSTRLLSAILAVTIGIPFAFYTNFLLVTFRSKDAFDKLSIIKLAEAFLSLATLPMVYFFHYEGMIARIVLVGAILVLLMHLYRPMRVAMQFDRGALKQLLKTGIPIFGLDYLKNSAGTLDRLVVLKVSGVEGVGYYALASMVCSTLQVLPQSLSAYVYPRMSYSFGQNGDSRALWRFGLKFVLLAVSLTGLAALSAWLLLPKIVPLFAPKYAGGIRAAEIMLIAGVLEGVGIAANALWSMKTWKVMVSYQVLSSAMLALGPIFGVIFIDRSLEGVAWGVALGSLCQGLLTLGATYYGTHKTVRLG
jgi:O-antigen/teichoic acid export membrane protein